MSRLYHRCFTCSNKERATSIRHGISIFNLELDRAVDYEAEDIVWRLNISFMTKAGST